MIKEFITDVCELLEIRVPKISYDTTHFATSTTMAQCKPETNTIYLNKVDKPNPDYVFSLLMNFVTFINIKLMRNFIYQAINHLINAHQLKNTIFRLLK